MPVHRRWLVLVFGLLALLCCAAFYAAIVPFNARGNRLWDLRVAAMADGSVTVEEFAEYDKLALQDTHVEATVLILIAGGCVVVMSMLLPVWVYSEPPGGAASGKKRVQK